MRRLQRIGPMLALGAALVGCTHHAGLRTTRPLPPAQTVAGLEESGVTFARLEEDGWDPEACELMDRSYERLSYVERTRRGQQLRSRALYMRGLVASRCGDGDAAETHWQAALQADSSLCEAWVALALRADSAGDEREAMEILDRARSGSHQCAAVYRTQAAIQARHPELRTQAVRNLRRALAIDADDVAALERLARIYLEQGATEPSRLDLAAVICRQAQLIDPERASTYNTWALVDLARGDLNDATKKLERARELDPTFFEAQMNFGQLTLSQRAYEDAEDAFARARALRPESYDAAIGLGVALRGLGRPEEAERLYREAIAIDANRPEAYFDLALLYQDHREGTVEQLRQAEAMLAEFVARARAGRSHPETLQSVLRWCGRRRRCRPGRAQNIHDTLVALGERAEEDRPDWTM